jgi:hypothetical protein
MRSPSRSLLLTFGSLAGATMCLAQLAISTHSGLVQFTMGSVFLEEKPLQKTTTNVVEMKTGQTLRTGNDGHAELLLTPGVFLRLGNDSVIRMDSNALSDTRVSLVSGSAMVECDELLADNSVSFTVGNQTVELRKKGLYRLEASPPAVGVLKGGQAFVAGNLNTTVKSGKLLQLDGATQQPDKFKLDKDDELYAFSKARSEDSAYATGVTTSSLYSSGFNSCATSSWYFMNSVGMYSYVPCRGIYNNPFGYSFFGLNAGYLWDGPYYYVPPYALIGVPRAVGGGGGGGSAVLPGSTGTQKPGTTTPGGSGNQAGINPQRPAPVFVGPGYRGPSPSIYVGAARPGMAGSMQPRVSTPAARGMSTMAGPAVGRSAVTGASRGISSSSASHVGGVSAGASRGMSAPSPSMSRGGAASPRGK